MKIREIKVKKECIICKGKGCYDCNDRGWTEEYITFTEFMEEIRHYMVVGNAIYYKNSYFK